MSAQEMFEKQNYMLIENNENYITYEYVNKAKDKFTIAFCLKYKVYDFECIIGDKDIYGNEVDLCLHNAINKQIEELGWNDETTKI